MACEFTTALPRRHYFVILMRYTPPASVRQLWGARHYSVDAGPALLFRPAADEADAWEKAWREGS